MLTILDEASSLGKHRVNAATTLSVAAIEMNKTTATLKAASKAFANATSQLSTGLKAAHQMTEKELKAYKGLLDRIDTTKDKLKKYVLWADENAKAANELATELKKPGPSGRPGAEPDPDKPLSP